MVRTTDAHRTVRSISQITSTNRVNHTRGNLPSQRPGKFTTRSTRAAVKFGRHTREMLGSVLIQIHGQYSHSRLKHRGRLHLIRNHLKCWRRLLLVAMEYTPLGLSHEAGAPLMPFVDCCFAKGDVDWPNCVRDSSTSLRSLIG